MSKAIFLVHRIAYYRYYVPLIKEALRRGRDVEVWHDYGYPKTGTKAGAFPDIAFIPKISEGVIKPVVFNSSKVFFDNEELKQQLLKLSANDIVFSLHQPFMYWKDIRRFELPFKWIALQHNIDDFFEMLDKEPCLFKNSFFAAYTKNWIDRGKDFLDKFSKGRNSETLDSISSFTAGQPEFDIFDDIKDLESLRNKYGIPKEKKIALYLPFPYQNWNPVSAWERAFSGMAMNTFKGKNGVFDHRRKMFWHDKVLGDFRNILCVLKDPEAFGYWHKGITENNVFSAIKRFCRNNNLFLVVKPRLKFPVSEYIKKNCDLLVLDDEIQTNPPRLKELLMLSSVAFSYYSASVFSAAFSGVYHVNIVTPKSFFPDEKSKFFFSEDAGSAFNYDGVTRCMTPEQIIATIGNNGLSGFEVNQLQRRKYISDYIGFDDFASSKRIFDKVS